MHRLMLWVCCCVFTLTTLDACAIRHVQQTAPSIQHYESEEGTCTAWSVKPYRWVTAAHCLDTTFPVGLIGETPAIPIAADTKLDLLLVEGPLAPALSVATTQPPIEGRVTLIGFGLGHPTLLFFSGKIIDNSSDFFGAAPEMLIGDANGMPGMSGGPILYRGRVVSIVTGGGAPTSFTSRVSNGPSWRNLSRFLTTHLR